MCSFQFGKLHQNSHAEHEVEQKYHFQRKTIQKLLRHKSLHLWKSSFAVIILLGSFKVRMKVRLAFDSFRGERTCAQFKFNLLRCELIVKAWVVHKEAEKSSCKLTNREWECFDYVSRVRDNLVLAFLEWIDYKTSLMSWATSACNSCQFVCTWLILSSSKFHTNCKTTYFSRFLRQLLSVNKKKRETEPASWLQ